MTSNSEFTKHTPGPCPVNPDQLVIARMEADGYELAPMPARDIDWDFPGDQVVDYKIVPTIH